MKLLASDFDGTLLLHPNKDDNVILKNDKKAIKTFQEKGSLFGICTGRGLEGILKYSEDIVYDFYILNSGAVILNKDKEIIQANYLNKELIIKIMNYFDEKICCTFVENGHMYVKNPDKEFPSHIACLTSLDELGDCIEAFSMHFSDDIKKATKIKNMISEQFGDEIAVYQNIDNIDMCAKGCSKGNGLKVVQQYFYLNEDDMHVIGDSWNDIPMFECYKNSFTFKNSPEDVKNKTKYQVETIEECICEIMEKGRIDR